MIARASRTLALAVLVLLSGLTAAHAGAYFVALAPNGNGTCTASGFDLPVIFSYNVPATGTVPSVQVDTLNGQVVFTGPDDFAIAGSGSGPVIEQQGTSPAFPATLPYTFERAFTFYVDGLPISRVDFKFDCSAAAGMTNVSVTTLQLAPNPVPALGHVALILLGLGLMLGSAHRLRRART